MLACARTYTHKHIVPPCLTSTSTLIISRVLRYRFSFVGSSVVFPGVCSDTVENAQCLGHHIPIDPSIETKPPRMELPVPKSSQQFQPNQPYQPFLPGRLSRNPCYSLKGLVPAVIQGMEGFNSSRHTYPKLESWKSY